MAGDKEEKKSVTQDELKAGVRLTAGHRVVLIVEGAVAETTTEAPGEPETTEPPATTTEAPGTTTTAGPSTTTTAAPEETTTEPAPEETTTAASTTTSPSTTTSLTTTTAGPSSTTTAPATTTTGAPSSTTTAPSTTTTASTQASVVVELPEEALDLLPDGALTLSGEGLEDQQIAFSAAEHADGVLRFKFQWDGISVKTKLVAMAGSGSVTLWEDQAAGDPEQPILWSGAVSDLYPALEAPETDAVEAIGAAIDDLKKLILEAFP